MHTPNISIGHVWSVSLTLVQDAPPHALTCRGWSERRRLAQHSLNRLGVVWICGMVALHSSASAGWDFRESVHIFDVKMRRARRDYHCGWGIWFKKSYFQGHPDRQLWNSALELWKTFRLRWVRLQRKKKVFDHCLQSADSLLHHDSSMNWIYFQHFYRL